MKSTLHNNLTPLTISSWWCYCCCWYCVTKKVILLSTTAFSIFVSKFSFSLRKKSYTDKILIFVKPSKYKYSYHVPKYNILQHKNNHLEQHNWPRMRDREHTENRVEANCIRRWKGWKCPLLIRILSVMKCSILIAPSKWNHTQPTIFTYISRIIVFVWKFIQIFTQCDTFIIFRTSRKVTVHTLTQTTA